MSEDSKRYIVGVDTGGTFTDVVVVDRDSGETYVAKAPTTPHVAWVRWLATHF